MEIARQIGDFDASEADKLRIAMTKISSTKVGDQEAALRLIEPMKEKLFTNAKAKGLTQEYLDDLYFQIKSFTTYGFNRAHATSYGWLGYITLYLKANYPIQFFAGLLCNTSAVSADNSYQRSTINSYVKDAISHGIIVLPPDVNYSQPNWSIQSLDSSHILRSGLSILRNIGDKPAIKISSQRPYKSFDEFFEKNQGRECSLKVYKSLVASNSFASLKISPEEAWQKYCLLRKENLELNVSKSQVMNNIIFSSI